MIRCQTSGGRKSRMLFTLLLFMSFSPCFGQEQGYAVFDSSTGTLTFQYGTPTGTYYNTDNTGTIDPGWSSKRESIKKVVFDSSFDKARPTSCHNWFYECYYLTDITGIKYLKTSEVTDMYGMFYKCSALTNLDLSHFDTSKVTDMQFMFAYCSGLTSLNVSNFITSKVTNMGMMFGDCSSLANLDVSHFDTSKVTDMQFMFWRCSSLTKLDVSHFDTSKVPNMQYMFFYCSGLTSLDVSHFDTSNVTNMEGMFYGCSGLKSLNLSNFNTEKVTTMKIMFWECSGLTSLDVSHFDTSKVTNMNGVFAYCSGLTSLDVSHFDTSNVTTDMRGVFAYCSGLTSLDVSNFNTSKVTDMYGMFINCENLTSLTFGENFSTASIKSISKMFSGCSKLRYIDFYASKNVDAIKAVDRSNASDRFYGVPKTTVIYLPKGSQAVSNVVNVVYSYDGDGNDLRCPNYYSEDKVDIELPRKFKTTKAEYHRTMSNKSNYGSVVLPYAFTTDANIQAYTLDEEHTETMFFKDATTVAAHTPFAFKKLQSGNTADFVMTDVDFGITVEATHTTSAEERGEPYTHNENLDGWTTKGYYINETVADYDGAFYIAKDNFYKASDDLTLYPHRVTFHGAWTKSGTSGEAQFYNINTVSDSETITAIEAADLRHTRSVAAEVYDVAGRRQPEMVKGLNIVRMNDGSVRKVSIR